MEELRKFLNSLTLKEQRAFAVKCGTSLAYLRKSISNKSILGAEICVSIERESNGAVTRKQLVPHWHLRWPELIE